MIKLYLHCTPKIVPSSNVSTPTKTDNNMITTNNNSYGQRNSFAYAYIVCILHAEDHTTADMTSLFSAQSGPLNRTNIVDIAAEDKGQRIGFK